jgi:hypothetical protein
VGLLCLSVEQGRVYASLVECVGIGERRSLEYTIHFLALTRAVSYLERLLSYSAQLHGADRAPAHWFHVFIPCAVCFRHQATLPTSEDLGAKSCKIVLTTTR